MATNTQTLTFAVADTCPHCGQAVKLAKQLKLSNLAPNSCKVYLFLREYFAENKIMPSMREIARYMNTGTSMAHLWLNDLEDMGFISRKPKVSRGIVLL